MLDLMQSTEEREWQWSAGLPGFLLNSNEDAHNIDFVSGLIALRSANTRPVHSVRIADLGCGSAEKSVGVMKKLTALGIISELDLIDNDAGWLDQIITVTGRCEQRTQVYVPLDANQWLRAEQHRPPHWALLLHVPYSTKTEILVRRACTTLIPTGTVVLTSAESQGSDLALLRNHITAQTGIPTPCPRISSLCKWLKEQPYHFWRTELGAKWLRLPSDGHLRSADWLVELVAGRSMAEFSSHELAAFHKAMDIWIHTQKRNGDLLLIPDDVLVIWRRYD